MSDRKRININIDTDISDEDAVRRVLHVIADGLVSSNETQYCYVTTWSDGIQVFADRNSLGNDSFWVQTESPNE